jgi:hypothetical protein
MPAPVGDKQAIKPNVGVDLDKICCQNSLDPCVCQDESGHEFPQCRVIPPE